jgi:hypothetical protein
MNIVVDPYKRSGHENSTKIISLNLSTVVSLLQTLWRRLLVSSGSSVSSLDWHNQKHQETSTISEHYWWRTTGEDISKMLEAASTQRKYVTPFWPFTKKQYALPLVRRLHQRPQTADLRGMDHPWNTATASTERCRILRCDFPWTLLL